MRCRAWIIRLGLGQFGKRFTLANAFQQLLGFLLCSGNSLFAAVAGKIYQDVACLALLRAGVVDFACLITLTHLGLIHGNPACNILDIQLKVINLDPLRLHVLTAVLFVIGRDLFVTDLHFTLELGHRYGQVGDTTLL